MTVICLVAAHSLAAQTPPHVGGDVAGPVASRTAAWRWTGAVPAGGTLEVRLVRGSVRAESIDGPSAAVELVRHGVRSDPASARLAVDTTAARVRVEDRYPRIGPMARLRECLPPDDGRGDYWHSDVRLETIVRVPAGVRLVVHLVEGDIDVRGLTGPRDVSTNGGAVLGIARQP